MQFQGSGAGWIIMVVGKGEGESGMRGRGIRVWSRCGKASFSRHKLAAMTTMQGTISPVYMLNGLGEFLTRRGEGVLGFNYSVTGAADAPDISVNALSVLAPGFLRDLLRGPPAKLDKAK